VKDHKGEIKMKWIVEISKEIDEHHLASNTHLIYTIEIESDEKGNQRAFRVDSHGRQEANLKWALEVLKESENEGA